MNVLMANDPTVLQSQFMKTNGHQIVHSLFDADIVQFWGGPDINGKWYGRPNHPSMNLEDDILLSKEVGLWRMAKMKNVPCVGVCRGGQLLNVLNGGDIYQDVDRHTRDHDMIDVISNSKITVTSTHHQMMIPADTGWVLATAHESTERKWMGTDGQERVSKGPYEDNEVIFYGDTLDLCFQPHPEYTQDQHLHNYYFELIVDFLGAA